MQRPICSTVLLFQAYAGSPVETDFLDGNGDFIYGARLSHGVRNLYEIGFSYLRENGDDSFEREEEGVDLWYRPVNKVQLVGNILIQLGEIRMAGAFLQPRARAFQRIYDNSDGVVD